MGPSPLSGLISTSFTWVSGPKEAHQVEVIDFVPHYLPRQAISVGLLGDYPWHWDAELPPMELTVNGCIRLTFPTTLGDVTR
ncbi:hypothetical protein FKP32DRAFT_1594016 [Trametes sanguinea]|nr:hypothetical protein FKP32DRAFT_1594016 [Trametes sanguinea]